MSRVAKVYHLLKRAIPPHLRTKLRNTIEYLFDVYVRKYYSQFGEDAILQSYFEEKAWDKNPERRERNLFFLRPWIETGFYVDVGAYRPASFSNTYCFYKRGWRGINIDATPGSMREFNLMRERDTNLEVAVSDRELELVFHCFSDNEGRYGPCVHNTLSPETAPGGDLSLDRPPGEVRFQSLRLDTILDRHLPEGQLISFLSVDVEGHELEVLRSNDWSRYRPELVVVEQFKDAIQEILESSVHRFLEEVGYSLYSWAQPSLIYKADDMGPDP